MPNEPVSYKGVMVSSTFTDLVEHRRALIRAIDGQKLKPVVMENDSAKPDVDVLDSSLEMVRDASAYVGVISHKYGQIPEDLNHPIKRGDVETDPGKVAKLNAFRERAKRMGPDSAVHRVYDVFNDLSEFKDAASQSVAELRRYLDAGPAPRPEDDLIPAPPALYAEPPYIGSHPFVGREAQLALANLHLGHLGESRYEAERLAQERNPSHYDLAVLWLAIGDTEQAKTHALAAYPWAWADGEPYVRRYELDKARGLLEQLGVEVPSLPPYDPAKDEELPWEQDVTDAVAKALAERDAAHAEGDEET